MQVGAITRPEAQGDSFFGFDIGARALSAETEFSLRIPHINRTLYVGIEGELGSIGARLMVNEGRLRIGKSFGYGGGVSFGFRRAGDCCD